MLDHDDSPNLEAPTPAPTPPPNPNTHGGDSRKDIYIHSKVLLIDQIFGLLGSANHNERSMWHDSEDALAFRSSKTCNIVGVIRNELMGIVLSGNLPLKFDGLAIFRKFEDHLDFNTKQASSPKSLIYPLDPPVGFGNTLIS